MFGYLIPNALSTRCRSVIDVNEYYCKEILDDIQHYPLRYKSKTSFGIAYEFDPVMVSRLCDHRVDACGIRFELRCLWCMVGLSGNNSVKWQPTKVDPY